MTDTWCQKDSSGTLALYIREGEVNSIFTAEDAEDRRELQREIGEQGCVFAHLSEPHRQALLRSSALLCALCGKKRETLNYNDATFAATVSDQQCYSGSLHQSHSACRGEISPERR